MIAVILFNGIRFPFLLAEKALAWAKENKAAVLALFLKSADETGEGYIFPSDLDASEDLADTEDAENANVRVIEKNTALLKSEAKTAGIECETSILTDPSIDELLDLLNNKDRVFAEGSFDESGVLKSGRFDLSELKNKARIPFEEI